MVVILDIYKNRLDNLLYIYKLSIDAMWTKSGWALVGILFQLRMKSVFKQCLQPRRSDSARQKIGTVTSI